MTSSSPARVLNLLAVFFIVLGTVWFSFIQSRCYEISPRPAFSTATSAVTIAESGPTKVRSPYAKPWHDQMFFFITTVEVFAAIFYVLAGLFLLRRFVLTKFAVTLALGLHVLLMIFVIGFMKLGAIPLS